MPHLSVKTDLGRRLGVAGFGLAIAVGLASALWLTSARAPADASVAQTASTLDSSLAAGDRAEMRQDLKAARELERGARRDAIKEIRADAKAGKYGNKVQKKLDRRADHRAAVLALLPDELQADLKELKAADKKDRKAMRNDIRAKALSGGYGDKVKEAAGKLKDHWQK
ncbi:hypothetical protein [Aeromicrobium sp.]|uniref:hypothetical protein n=1 Tax=Aeromicrobium sp. TaxID=1871063 RepID=UPI0030BD7384